MSKPLFIHIYSLINICLLLSVTFSLPAPIIVAFTTVRNEAIIRVVI